MYGKTNQKIENIFKLLHKVLYWEIEQSSIARRICDGCVGDVQIKIRLFYRILLMEDWIEI